MTCSTMSSPSEVSTWALMSPPSNGLAITTMFIFISPTEGTSGGGISSRMRLAASIQSLLRNWYCSATGPPEALVTFGGRDPTGRRAGAGRCPPTMTAHGRSPHQGRRRPRRHLARLELSDAELDRYTEQLGAVLDHADDVDALDLADVPPTAHPLPLVNVLRPDVVGPCADRDEVLAQAPSVEDGRFRVPAILGEEP